MEKARGQIVAVLCPQPATTRRDPACGPNEKWALGSTQITEIGKAEHATQNRVTNCFSKEINR